MVKYIYNELMLNNRGALHFPVYVCDFCF